MTEIVSNLMEANLLGVFNERDAQRRALAIASTYAPDVRWTDDEGRGIDSVLLPELGASNIYIEYMDTKRFYGRDSQVQFPDLYARKFTPAFGGVMREVVEKARGLFLEGLPLVGMVDRRLALDIDLFNRGGMRVLDKIEERDYNVLAERPAISKVERVWLLLASLARVAFSRAA